MKSYLKFLSRNKLYTVIEAIGLIVSLALAILVGSSVKDQLSIAKKVPGGQNLFILGPQSMPYLEYRDLEALTSLPEVEEVAAFMPSKLSIKASGEFTKLPVLIADTRLLSLLDIEVIQGSLASLQSGQGVALTESAASRLFPFADALGQSISIGSEGYGAARGEMERAEIVAIVEDTDHTILESFDIICPMGSALMAAKAIRESDMRNSGIGMTAHAIASLAEGTDLEAFSEKFISLMGPTLDRKEDETMMATPYTELYFSPTDISGIRQGKRLYLHVIIVLGLVLLLSAVLNFMNLCSAISGGRAKEMATRRLLGESREGVFRRILLETILFTVVSCILAILLAWAIVPYLNSIRPEGIPVAFRVADEPVFWLVSGVTVLLVGTFAGLLPAWMLSSFEPIEVVNGSVRRRLKMGFNKVCIIVQTILAVVLVCMAITLQSQLKHLENLDLGISPTKNLFYFHPSWYYSQEVHLLGNRLASLPDVKSVCYTDGIPTHIRSLTMGPSNAIVHLIDCDTLAFRLLGFQVKEGFAGVKPGTFWPTEEFANFCGISRDNPDIYRILPRAQGDPSETGGILESFRRLAVNAEDPYARYADVIFPAVNIPSSAEGLTGILIETGPDHQAFRKEFTKIVTDHYKETVGVPDLGNSFENQFGYLEDIIAADYADLHRYAKIVTLFGLVAVFLAMLGIVAMSTWFASRNAREIAVRKVFGSDTSAETIRSIRSYMVLTLISVAMAIPVSIVLVNRFLERYAERITGYWWIFVSAALLAVIVSLFAVFWQTLKAAKTNPAVELKKE